jgi:polyvinyl alcohol dehydrogenase (cytochrome)
VVALDFDTGEIVWKTYMAPDLSSGFSGNAVWGSTPVVDPKRGSLYVTTGNNYTAPQAVLDCADAGGPADVRACVYAVPGSAENYFDSIVALDVDTGDVRWVNTVIPFDAWNAACFPFFDDTNCPTPAGPDYDFGQGPALFRTSIGGKKVELLGAGQKSGMYWAVNPDTGETVWSTQVGPGGELGGLQWGSAVDGERIYTAVSNSRFLPHILSDGSVVEGGFWAALDAATGTVLWETVGYHGPTFPGPFTPEGAIAQNQGPVSVANGVVFAGAVDDMGTMYAFDAASGAILWSFASGGSVNSGAAIVDGTVYWGSGYGNFGVGTPNNKLYAFHIPGQE